ncbi:HD-GYP domain-containing protein [Hyalangium versicolor]|uniref:HD-GYP domain-containing protein n=1 Tax=Hyalangium versicolor TaxID=2861190 RepID=UPI001CCBC437|nr:hypothetical protein [Hyalangium versicolor]
MDDTSTASDAKPQMGLLLLSAVVRCLHAASLHDVENASTKEALEELGTLLDSELKGQKSVELQCMGGIPFMSGKRIKLGEEHLDTAISLRRYLEPLQVEEIAFGSGLKRQDLRSFLLAFQKHRRTPTPQKIQQEPMGTIRLRATLSTTQTLSPREVLLRYYARLVVLLNHAIESKHPVRIERFRRALHRLAEASQGLEPQLIGLTRFRRPKGEGGHHGAAVAVLTLLMARRLGVSRSQQIEMALNGLFHDLGRGMAGQAPEQQFDRTTHELMTRRGPLKSAMRLLQQPLNPSQLERVVTAHESLQPAWGNQGQRSVGVAGRLISVPCAFDLLTFPAPPHPGLPADQALRLIMSQADSRFDPRVVRLFTTVAGFYPVGTLVKLSGGQIGVVMDVPANPAQATRPRVRVIQGAGKSKADYVIDLAEPGQRVIIVSSVATTENDLNAPHFLFS